MRDLILEFAFLPTATSEPCCGVLAVVHYVELRVVLLETRRVGRRREERSLGWLGRRGRVGDLAEAAS